jgi:RND family efflux transporter MFP subunit
VTGKPWIMVLCWAWANSGWSADPPPVELTTRVSGVVAEVLVKDGKRVKRGEVLLRLSPVIYEARLAAARAELARATEEEADAKRDLDRVQELYNRSVSATTELDAAKLRHARAKAGQEAASARLAIARKNLEDTELKAPFDLVVVQRLAEPGVVVAAECQPRTLLLVRRVK